MNIDDDTRHRRKYRYFSDSEYFQFRGYSPGSGSKNFCQREFMPLQRNIPSSKYFSGTFHSKEIKGHTRDTIIPSHGLIIFHIKDAQIFFLIYQRRDTYEYIDFVRGAWSNEAQLPQMFMKMTKDEKDRLINNSFDDILTDIRVGRSDGYFYDCEDKARKKFEKIKDKLPYIINNIKISGELDWGFPKGKKNINECDLECACREFSEETRISISHVNIIHNILPLVETFRGSNGKMYSTTYFVGQVSNAIPIVRTSTPYCIRKDCVSEEAADVKWVTIEEACTVLNDKRINMLKRIISLISTSIETKLIDTPSVESK